MASMGFCDDLELNSQIEILRNKIHQLELVITDSNKTIPPPNIFSGSRGSIDDFLYLFERYCVSIYGEDQLSWLQVLPSYLEGEARNIVLAFGLDRNIDYAMVKERLLWELKPSGLQDRYYQDFCVASKCASESYSCYSIRLEVLLGRVAHLTNDIRRFLVISKFLSCLPSNILETVTIEVANEPNVNIRQLVTLVKNVQLLGVPENDVCSDIRVTNVKAEYRDNDNIPTRKRFPNGNKCFRCQLSGHYKVSCTAKLIKCKDCHQYHHKLVKCSMSFNNPYFSGDVDWTSKSILSPNDSILLSKHKTNNPQNKSCSIILQKYKV